MRDALATIDILERNLNVITARSRELLFQMAMQQDKFRTTISRMKKNHPELNAEFDSTEEAVDKDYKENKDYQSKMKAYTDTLPLDPLESTLDIVLQRKKNG